MAIDFTKYKNKISNSGHDENGVYHGGVAGDQSGSEWEIRNWYNRPWSYILRHPKQEVRELLAELAIEAANNNKIGYDQYQRDTYWKQLQAVGYRPKNITTACEADCSAGVIANTKAVGNLLNIDALKNLKATYTGDMLAGFKAAGFEALSETKYLTSSDYLVPGDILLKPFAHTATNLGYGAKIPVPATTTSLNRTPKFTGIITASTLNIRTWAGTEYPKLKKYPQLKKDTKVGVCDSVKAKDGSIWYYICYNGVYGFAHSAYIK